MNVDTELEKVEKSFRWKNSGNQNRFVELYKVLNRKTKSLECHLYVFWSDICTLVFCFAIYVNITIRTQSESAIFVIVINYDNQS